MTTELIADDFELVINPMSPTFKNKPTYICNLAVGKKLQFYGIDIKGSKLDNFWKLQNDKDYVYVVLMVSEVLHFADCESSDQLFCGLQLPTLISLARKIFFIKGMFKPFVVGIRFVVCYTYFSLSFLNPVISRSGYWFLFLRVNLILFTHLITILRSVRGQCGIYSMKSSLISDSNFVDKFANTITSMFFLKKK